MPVFLANIAAKLAGSRVGAFLGKIPRWVWVVLGCVLLGLLASWWHTAAIRKHDRAIIAAEDQRLAAKALKLKQQVDDLLAKTTALERKANDAQNRRIASTADTLRLSGPGKAICRASIPAAASGYQPASGNGNAAGPQVPAGDLAAVPWGWLVDRAEEHDLDRQEALAWRQWYAKMVANWPK